MQALRSTVITYPRKDISVSTEKRLLKAALVHSDHVDLVSPTLTMAIAPMSLHLLSDEQKVDFILEIAPTLDREFNTDEFREMSDQWKRASQMHYPTRRQRELIKAFRPMLARMSSQFQELAQSISAQVEFDEFAPFIDSGMLRIFAPEDYNLENYPDWMASVIRDVLEDPTAFPVFDRDIQELVIAMEREGMVNSSTQPARSALFNQQLVIEIPAIDDFPIGSVLELKEELADPLARFRRYLGDFAKQSMASAYSEEFNAAIMTEYRDKVVPELDSIHQAISENRYMRRLWKQVSENAGKYAIVLAVLVGLTKAADIQALVGMLPLVGEAAARASATRNSASSEIKQNPLYFYHELRRVAL